MRFRPHLYTFSTLAPFSVAVVSSVAMILSISLSGVSGWQIKITSYWRSSICPLFLSFLAALQFRLLRTFGFGRYAAVVFQHRLFHALGQNLLHCFGRVHSFPLRFFSLRTAHRGEQVILA